MFDSIGQANAPVMVEWREHRQVGASGGVLAGDPAVCLDGGRTLSLFWQIVVFLIVAAALGFVIGWLLRGTRMESERPAAAPRQSGGEAALADERDRLQTELRVARDAQARLEASVAESQKLADARAGRVRELEQAEVGSRQQIARLEGELRSIRAAAEREAPPEPAKATVAAPQVLAELSAEGAVGTPPSALAAPEGVPDDLKQISGIGPGIEKILHELGIYHFRQIARFTPDNVAWVNQRLRFKGRIEREDWIGQAKKLAVGERTD
jgi:predicted flap endonuclease-1-like 5' DNA nuclease